MSEREREIYSYRRTGVLDSESRHMISSLYMNKTFFGEKEKNK